MYVLFERGMIKNTRGKHFELIIAVCNKTGARRLRLIAARSVQSTIGQILSH